MSERTNEPLYWVTPGRRGTRCNGCGEDASGQPIAYCHDRAYEVFCLLCAETRGLRLRESKAYRQWIAAQIKGERKRSKKPGKRGGRRRRSRTRDYGKRTAAPSSDIQKRRAKSRKPGKITIRQADGSSETVTQGTFQRRAKAKRS